MGEGARSGAVLGAGGRFTWGAFALGLGAGGALLLIVGLILDRVLIFAGIELHPWRDAAQSAAFGIIFGGPGLLLVWRIGIVTLRQYILSALILFAPLTVLSLFALALVEDVVLSAPWIDDGEISAHDLAYTAYLRIARSALLTPFFLLAFWSVYHRWLGRAPRAR